jgi:hypothetical protein
MQIASSAKQLREESSFAYSKEIAKPFGQLDGILDWCRSELNGEWRWKLITVSSDISPGRYLFFFDSERDACAFTMQWA